MDAGQHCPRVTQPPLDGATQPLSGPQLPLTNQQVEPGNQRVDDVHRQVEPGGAVRCATLHQALRDEGSIGL